MEVLEFIPLPFSYSRGHLHSLSPLFIFRSSSVKIPSLTLHSHHSHFFLSSSHPFLTLLILLIFFKDSYGHRVHQEYLEQFSNLKILKSVTSAKSFWQVTQSLISGIRIKTSFGSHGSDLKYIIKCQWSKQYGTSIRINVWTNGTK